MTSRATQVLQGDMKTGFKRRERDVTVTDRQRDRKRERERERERDVTDTV